MSDVNNREFVEQDALQVYNHATEADKQAFFRAVIEALPFDALLHLRDKAMSPKTEEPKIEPMKAEDFQRWVEEDPKRIDALRRLIAEYEAEAMEDYDQGDLAELLYEGCSGLKNESIDGLMDVCEYYAGKSYEETKAEVEARL